MSIKLTESKLEGCNDVEAVATSFSEILEWAKMMRVEGYNVDVDSEDLCNLKGQFGAVAYQD